MYSALAFVQHDTVNLDRLLLFPFGSVDGFLHQKSLNCPGGLCFFSTEKAEVQMQREISIKVCVGFCFVFPVRVTRVLLDSSKQSLMCRA